MAEQAGKWGPEMRPLTPAAGARQFRASDWGGARGRGSHPRTRAASGLRLGTQRSPAGSRLIGGANAPESAARRRKENAAAERRKARLARVMGWVISGDPEMGPIARRTTGCG